MKARKSDCSTLLIKQARKVLQKVYLPRIVRCLQLLTEKEIWTRPNAASNSVGNLVLHLEGNVRQWIISGLGGAPDIRQRDREFREQGPIPRLKLSSRLERTVREACRVIQRLPERDLTRVHTIQGFRVMGLTAVFHVAEHFSHHAGQIILATKMLRGVDLKFTHLPGQTKKAQPALPAV